MSPRKETPPKDARARRLAEALRRNLKRRKLQVRGRAAVSAERDEPDESGPAGDGKQGR